MMTRRLASATLLSLLLGGCGNELYLGDDQGAPRPGGEVPGERPDELGLPYALGTKVRISVQGPGAQETGAWLMRSDAPAVLVIDKLAVEDQRLVAECTATGEGQARIRLLD